MNDVTVGIDIGTTSVKAVAADDDGNVLSRARIPHRVVAPDPGRFEHGPREAWFDGVLAAWNDVTAGAAGRSVTAVTVSAMVPSMCGVDSAGMPVTPGLLCGDARGRTPAVRSSAGADSDGGPDHGGPDPGSVPGTDASEGSTEGTRSVRSLAAPSEPTVGRGRG